MRHRVASGSRAFEVQKFSGLDKDGIEQWRAVAYFRRRSGVAAFLQRNRLPLHLSDGLPEFHGDVASAIHRFCQTEGAALNAARVRSELALARKKA